MSDEPKRTRRPGTFRLDEALADRPVAPPAEEAPRSLRPPRAFEDLERVALEPEEAIDEDVLAALDPAPRAKRRRGFSFGKLFFGALGVLVSLGVALAVDSLVRDLFERWQWLGWVALAVAGLLLVGALGVIIREAVGLMRLAAVDRERQRGLAAYEANSAEDAGIVVEGLISLLSDRPETASGRARLKTLESEVIDGADLIALAEREILGPLDRTARALVLGSAKRVSVITATSPKAVVDVAYVLYETIKLIRRMSELYGARPGTLGLMRLTRDVLAHLAVTGTIGFGDSLLQQVVGHGVAAKLSARLGEGVVNGVLTARVGLAAMDLCRPLPFLRTKRPSLADMASELTAIGGSRSGKTKQSVEGWRGE